MLQPSWESVSRFYASAPRWLWHKRALSAHDKVRDSWRAFQDKAVDVDIVNLLRPQSHNVGDVAIGETIRRVCTERGLRCRTASIDDAWPVNARRGYIVGGGGLLSGRLLSRIERETKQRPVGIVGVEVFSEPVQRFPQNVVFAATRSLRSQEKLRRHGCPVVELMPDVVWALPRLIECPQSNGRAHRIVGINATPFPKPEHYRRLGQRTVDAVDRAGDATQRLLDYAEYVRAFAKAHLDAGWKVTCVPFEVEDYYFAREILRGLPVTHRPYSKSPGSVLKAVADCQLFLATRYHAHVFAMLTAVPLISVAYGVHTADLQNELPIPEDFRYPVATVLSHRVGSGFVLAPEDRSSLVTGAYQKVHTCLNALNV